MKGQTRLTEDMLHSLSTEQSFERGRQYYRAGAIQNAARQGDVLTAVCEGSSAPAYRLRVELDQAGVHTASCTCPYDWGGLCKHLVGERWLALNSATAAGVGCLVLRPAPETG